MSDYIIRNGELYHYGVLGMKWGVRRGRTQQAYEKASKKLKKLDEKVDKTEALATKRRGQADYSRTSMLVSKKRARKWESRARDASAKHTVAIRKAQKWYNSMEKTFADTNISMSKEQIAMGKRYAEAMKLRTIAR